MQRAGRKMSRRWFILTSLLCAPLAVAADARWLEPEWVKVRRFHLGTNKPTHRLVHFTDIHHKGDRAYLLSVVNKVNALSPDIVCFTGDLIEESKYLPEALEILAGIKSPVYGVPGNHDYWSKAPFDEIAKWCVRSGGAWLLDGQAMTQDRKLSIIGASSFTFKKGAFRLYPDTRNIFLMHYPAWIEKLAGTKLDLVLAGHSHGGQVRLPFYGPLMIPFGVAQYDMGMFLTAAGPLYVNPGIGWFPVPIRFNCRPEITVFEL